MFKTLWTFLTANWQERAIIAGILLALFLGAVVFGYEKGKGSCEATAAKETVKTVVKVKVVHDKVNSMPIGAVHDELRQHWQRQ